jgi:peroxiredoxin
MSHLVLAAVAVSSLSMMSAFSAPAKAAKVGSAAPAFTLTDLAGKKHTLASLKGKTVVLEWFCSKCPWSGKKSPRSVHSTGQVKTLVADLKKADPNVVYLTIDSSANMSKSDVIANDSKLKKEYEIAGPVLVDYDGTVGKAYGAKTTPHMFVIDKEGVLRYSGAFSDRDKQNYVLDAVIALQAGTAPKPATTKAWGCGVKYQR